MDAIIWHNERRIVSSLITWNINPRKITEGQLEQLKASVTKFNLADPIIVDTDNTIVGGHQRLTVLKLLGRGEEEIDVRIPNRKLTDEEFRELAIRLNRNQGEWDWDLLEEHFSVGDLLDFGFERFEFGLHNDELPEHAEPEDAEERTKVEFEASNKPRKEMVLFEVNMARENRDRLHEVIRKVKSEELTETTEEALMIIVNRFAESAYEVV